jgi:signal transduction histidine kinase
MNVKGFAIRSFRQKFFVSYLVLLFVFLALMFPFVAGSVHRIVYNSMNNRADELIAKLKDAKDEAGLIETIKDQKHYSFYRIGILDDQQRLLYDSHTRRLLRPLFFPLQFTSHPEVQQALETGVGYSEEYSYILAQKLIYVAKSFVFQGKTYVLRLAFPYQYTQELRQNFEIGFVLFSSMALILFSVMTGLVLHRLTSPIRQITKAIEPYHQGFSADIKKIELNTHPDDEFSQLANTLNSLSDLIRSHIESLTHERNEKEAILESLVEGVLAVDADMTLSYANTMALSLLGLDRSALGKPFPSNIHSRYFELLQLCQKESSLFTDAWPLVHQEKKLFLNILVCPRENKRGAILVLQDKSIHYKILEMRKDFIANASHELKTPITIIRGFAETLQDNLNLPRLMVVDITEKIVRNCERMTKTIRNLLTLADIENLPRSRIGFCNLVELAESCRQNLLSFNSKVQVDIFYNEEQCFDIACDRELLEVALSNLLDNAAKYSKDTPRIRIDLERLPNKIKIAVTDNGIGIPESELENIFQRFYRVNKMYSKKLGGSGLGLSIVETIVEKHFGKIFVTSTLGQGSSFTMLIADDLETRAEKVAPV